MRLPQLQRVRLILGVGNIILAETTRGRASVSLLDSFGQCRWLGRPITDMVVGMIVYSVQSKLNRRHGIFPPRTCFSQARPSIKFSGGIKLERFTQRQIDSSLVPYPGIENNAGPIRAKTETCYFPDAEASILGSGTTTWPDMLRPKRGQPP